MSTPLPNLVVMPDIEQLLIDWVVAGLAAQGQAIQVGTRLPDPVPAESVLIFRTGGVALTLVSDDPQVTVEARAADEPRAYQLAALVRGLCHQAQGRVLSGSMCYRVVDIGGPSNLPDVLTQRPRYTFTLGVHVGGSVQ